MKIIIFIFTIFCRVIFLHSTPVIPSSNAAPILGGLQRTQSDGANKFSDLEEKGMLFQIAYPNLSVVPLIPASVQIQSTLSEQQKKKVQENLNELKKIFKDYPTIRDTFLGMLFMLQNPHVMEMFLNASPSHKNGLPLANNSASAQMHALKILQLFENFVRSFSVSALLQSMGEVPPAVTSQGLAQLEKLYKILARNPDFTYFLQAVAFGLKLQESNPVQKNAPNPIHDIGRMLLAAKGGFIKTLGSAADTVFENVKDVNDMVQKYTSLLTNVPVLSDAVEPAKKYVNTILDGMHMVIGETAEAVGNTLQSQGSQPSRRQRTSSFANPENSGLDDLSKL